MPERLRAFLDRPLDPRAGLAILVLASAILLGFAVLFVLGASESDPPPAARQQAVAARPRQGASDGAGVLEARSPAPRRVPGRRRQDPQDEKASLAAERAAKAMRSHRALQHIPYRSALLSVRLIGARGGRAVLAVSAPTLSAARQGWRVFLGRYRDDGRAYLPRFEATGGHGG